MRIFPGDLYLPSLSPLPCSSGKATKLPNTGGANVHMLTPSSSIYGKACKIAYWVGELAIKPKDQNLVPRSNMAVL